MKECSISTWTHCVKWSSIENWGTQADKALLPSPTAWTKIHTTTWTSVINWEGQADRRRRVNKVAQKTIVRRAAGEEAAAAFEGASGSVE